MEIATRLFIKFGVGHKTLGRWCPGQQVRAARVKDLPEPSDILPVNNLIFHTGINDLRDRYTPLRPSEIVELMEVKCAAIHKLYPHIKIFISPLLPTRSRHLNKLVQETNTYIDMLSRKHQNLIMMDHNIFANREGFLLESLGSRKASDVVHLNLSGIIKLGLSFRSYISNRVGTPPGVFINDSEKSEPADTIDESREQLVTYEGNSPRCDEVIVPDTLSDIQRDGTTSSPGGPVPPRS